jgi:excisionase family DNA binding protein
MNDRGSKSSGVLSGQTLHDGHSAGTAAPETLARQGRRSSAPDRESSAPGWPRLLSLEEAARYLGVSPWTARELVNAGSIPVTPIPRPQTARMHRRQPVHDSLRRLLIDRCDLDRLVETWKVSG